MADKLKMRLPSQKTKNGEKMGWQKFEKANCHPIMFKVWIVIKEIR